MSEERIKVDMILVKLLCDKCGKEMKSTGIALACNPPKFPHECECGYVVQPFKQYPHTEYQPKNQS